jgi:signal peptidase II
MTRSYWAFLTALTVLALDRISKIIFVKILDAGQSVKIIPDIFHITLIHNTGAAFGMFKGRTQVFSLISLIVIVMIAVYLVRSRSVERVLAVSLGLILGGATANLIDRVWLGYVIDFLDFRIWPVFNIADSCITIGTIILAVNILFGKERNASCTR